MERLWRRARGARVTRARYSLATGLLLLGVSIAFAALTSSAAAQGAEQTTPADFDYTFEMPGQPTLQHIHAAVHMDSAGKITATIDYLNRDELSPFCGGLVVGVYSADGSLLQVFTTPIRCTPAMGANGNNPGEPWRRHFTWSAELREEYVPRASILDVRAVATGDVKVITDDQAREALEKRTAVVSSY
jgi:hypothetical protein